MEKVGARWIRIFTLVTVGLLTLFCLGAKGVDKAGKSKAGRSDVIVIDTLSVFGKLERPSVSFLHDQHTQALEKLGKDCKTCHLTGKNFEVIPDTLKSAVRNIDHLSPKFKRLKDIGRKEVMDIYHANCIGCHTELKDSGEKAGPVECGECHAERTISSNRLPMELDNSLHFRHSKALEKKCETCHHSYDEFKNKLFYDKGKEGTCRYCHLKEQKDNRISMKLASHLACISCHRERIAVKKSAGPVKCLGCHDPVSRAKIEKVAEVPRIERNQPDVVLVKKKIMEKNGKEGEALTEFKMNPVPFSHLIHEKKNASCRSCHHAGLEQCVRCHTLSGDKAGDFINLEEAMHRTNAQRSCLGCHEKMQKEKNCAGCHSFMKRKLNPATDCAICHMKLPDEIAKAEEKPEEAVVAKTLLDSRQKVVDTFKDEDIPEKVVIKEKVKKYQAVEFPHRKIVKTIFSGIKDSPLASYFHGKKEAICQGCHHNSPASMTPPRCIHCHGKPFDENQPTKPGIVAAYHRQCIGCHKIMEIKKVGCTDCHKEK